MGHGSTSAAAPGAEGLEEARRRTLWLTGTLDDAVARAQPHPEFSPLGWHLGHVAWQEEVWLHRRTFHLPPLDAAADRIFDPLVCAKARRGGALPPIDAIRTYAAAVRERSLELLERPRGTPGQDLGWVLRFLPNHERQHAEVLAIVRILGGWYLAPPPPSDVGAAPVGRSSARWLEIEEGAFTLGADDPEGWDNESMSNTVHLDPFRCSDRLVSNGEWLEFLESGGYQRDEFWSSAGRKFRDRQAISAPLHWDRNRSGAWMRRSLSGLVPLEVDHPVAHVSWFEAEAYASFRGARLPTEAEWERVAGWDEAAQAPLRWPNGAKFHGESNLWMSRGDTSPVASAPASRSGAFDLEGNVWEWTASTFLPYPGFVPGPYAGYSAPYFGPDHRVLRGGSYLSHPHMARAAFRNWLAPETRCYPSGLRLVA